MAVTSESEASPSDESNAREDSVSTDRLEDISQQHPQHRPQLLLLGEHERKERANHRHAYHSEVTRGSRGRQQFDASLVSH